MCNSKVIAWFAERDIDKPMLYLFTFGLITVSFEAPALIIDDIYGTPFSFVVLAGICIFTVLMLGYLIYLKRKLRYDPMYFERRKTARRPCCKYPVTGILLQNYRNCADDNVANCVTISHLNEISALDKDENDNMLMPIVKEKQPELWLNIEQFVLSSWKYSNQSGCDARNLTHSYIKIKKIYEIRNNILWENYTNSIDTVDKKGNSAHNNNFTNSILTQTAITPLDIEEVLLFHGTLSKNLLSIVREGFRLPEKKHQLYGKGVYLSDSAQKADQYTDSRSNRQMASLGMLVVRTVIGRSRELRCASAVEEVLQRYDTFIGGEGRRFKEFVKPKSEQCYPAFVIIYDRIFDTKELPSYTQV